MLATPMSEGIINKTIVNDDNFNISNVICTFKFPQRRCLESNCRNIRHGTFACSSMQLSVSFMK